MGNLSKREKILLFSSVFLLIIYLYYKFYLVSALQKIDELNQSIEIYKQQYTLLNSQDIHNENHNSDISNLETNYRIAINAIPVYEKNPDIAVSIKNIAEENKVALESLIIEEPYLIKQSKANNEALNNDNISKENNLNVVQVKTIIKGNIEEIIKFLASVEKDDRIAEINNIEINKDKQSSFQALISIYYYFSNNKENLK